MKKKLLQFLAVLALLAFSGTAALAADDNTFNVIVNGPYQTSITASVDVARRINLTYTGATNGRQYLLTAQADGGTAAAPTEDNLVYIDQVTASGGEVSYVISARETKSDQVYSIYLSSNADDFTEYTQVAICGVGVKDTSLDNVLLGDVNGDGNITAADAALALDYTVGKTAPTERQFKAADVNTSGTITAADAAQILDFTVGNITAFHP